MVQSNAHLNAGWSLSASVVIYRDFDDCTRRLVLRAAEKCSRVWLIDNTPVPAVSNQTIEQLSQNVVYIPVGRNIGYGAAHNLALEQVPNSRKHIHFILNPDVVVANGFFREMARLFRDHEVGMAMPRVLNADGTQQPLARRVPSPFDILKRMVKPYLKLTDGRFECEDLDWKVSNLVPIVSGCCMVVRGSGLSRVGLFDTRFFMYFEDYDLSRRFAEVYRVIAASSPTIIHQHGAGSRRSLRLFAHHLLSAYRYFAKHGWFRDQARVELNRLVHEYRPDAHSQ